MLNNVPQKAGNDFDALTNKAIKLASAVFKVTRLFCDGEALKNQMRNKSCDIVVEIIACQNSDKTKKVWYNTKVEIEGLRALFEIARNQNWVRSVNLEVLSMGYADLGREIEALSKYQPADTLSGQRGEVVGEYKKAGLSDRHNQIVEYLKGNGSVQIHQVCQLFPQISRRTLIRDLDRLAKAGVVERSGDGRGVSYCIRPITTVV